LQGWIFSIQNPPQLTTFDYMPKKLLSPSQRRACRPGTGSIHSGTKFEIATVEFISSIQNRYPLKSGQPGEKEDP
jgi:hypothetical protein